MEKEILITGGAGYIGSTTARLFEKKGVSTITLDDLSTGFKELNQSRSFYEGNLRDKELLKDIFQKHSIDSVIHFASHSLVAESVLNPRKYYKNNLIGTLSLLDTMLDFNVKKIIFSSSASVYGNTEENLISEEVPTKPLSPYGRTKLFNEEILKDYFSAYGLNSVSLRYFNACGADSDCEVGESHSPETHLIPLILEKALKEENFVINGSDYKTADGTCIRDFIHVTDLAEGHFQALQYLETHQGSFTFNLSTGRGYSIHEVLQQSEKILGKKIALTYRSRRAGDPGTLVGNPEKANKELFWKAKKSLKEVIQSALNWRNSEKFKRIKNYEKNSFSAASLSDLKNQNFLNPSHPFSEKS